MTEKTLNTGLGKPVATSTLRPKTGLSQRQRRVQAYRDGAGQHSPSVLNTIEMGGLSRGLKLLI